MTNKLPKITLVGHVCIDHNIINGTSYNNWGSAAMYMAHYFKDALAVNAQIIAPYGKDFQEYSAGVSIINQPNYSETLVYKNIVEGESRTQYCNYRTAAIPVKINAKLKAVLQETDILFVAPLIANYGYDYVSKVISYVPSSCLKVLLPQGYMRRINKNGLVSKVGFYDAEKIVPLFNVAIMSDEDCNDAFSVAQSWASYEPNLKVIVTENSKGATLFERETKRHIPTRPIAAKYITNSIGSGDVFSAQLAYSLYQQGNVYEAVSLAHKATQKKLLT